MISVRQSVQSDVKSGQSQMIDSVHIKNFRCFEDHSIKGLGTVNIVVGDNGAGKTALLEALFLSQPSVTAYYSTTFSVSGSSQETAAQFSVLSTQKKENKFIKAVKSLYPHIISIGVESEMGQPMLFGDIKGLPMKVPLAFISGGTQKLVAILLGMASQPKGLILIDEIENGFYYKTMPKVWETLLAFCKQYSVQIIATTHSRECLESALPTIKKNESRFRLIRMENVGGRRFSKVFKGDELEAAIETGVEFR